MTRMAGTLFGCPVTAKQGHMVQNILADIQILRMSPEKVYKCWLRAILLVNQENPQMPLLEIDEDEEVTA